MKFKKSCIKIAAWITLMAFSNQTLFAQSLPQSQSVFSSSEVRVFPDRSLLPAGMGKVNEIWGNASPSVFLIQDPHGQEEGQKNIRNMLEFIHGKNNFETLLMEGGIGQQDPSLLDWFTEKKWNDKAAAFLLHEGHIGGPELFLKENRQVKAEGLEALDPYIRNLKLFQSVIRERKATSSFLRDALLNLKTKASRGMTPTLYAFFKTWLSYESGESSFPVFLEQLENSAKETLNIDLKEPRLQLQWPMMVRYTELKRRQSLLNLQTAAEERAKLEAWTVKNLGRKLGTEFQDRRRFWELFYEEASPKGFDFKDYPALMLREGFEILQAEMDAALFFEEWERLRDEVLRALVKDEKAESPLLEEARSLLFLKKLFELELTPEEFRTVERGNAEKFLKTAPVEIRTHYQHSMDFYRTALERDTVMARAIVEHAKRSSKPVVAIAGGFHTPGLTQFFKEQNLSYALLSPHLSEIQPQEAYQAAMLGETRPLDLAQFTNRVPSEITPLKNWQGKLPQSILSGRAQLRRDFERSASAHGATTASRAETREDNEPVLMQRSEDRDGLAVLLEDMTGFLKFYQEAEAIENPGLLKTQVRRYSERLQTLKKNQDEEVQRLSSLVNILETILKVIELIYEAHEKAGQIYGGVESILAKAIADWTENFAVGSSPEDIQKANARLLFMKESFKALLARSAQGFAKADEMLSRTGLSRSSLKITEGLKSFSEIPDFDGFNSSLIAERLGHLIFVFREAQDLTYLDQVHLILSAQSGFLDALKAQLSPRAESREEFEVLLKDMQSFLVFYRGDEVIENPGLLVTQVTRYHARAEELLSKTPESAEFKTLRSLIGAVSAVTRVILLVDNGHQLIGKMLGPVETKLSENLEDWAQNFVVGSDPEEIQTADGALNRLKADFRLLFERRRLPFVQSPITFPRASARLNEAEQKLAAIPEFNGFNHGAITEQLDALISNFREIADLAYLDQVYTVLSDQQTLLDSIQIILPRAEMRTLTPTEINDSKINEWLKRARVTVKDFQETAQGMHLGTQVTQFIELIGAFPRPNASPFKVFDAGSGQGFFVFRLALERPNASVFGVEGNKTLYLDSLKVLEEAERSGEIAKGQIQFAHEDFNNPQFADKIREADIVYYYESGTSDEEAFQNTLLKNMKPGSRLIVLSSMNGSGFIRPLLETGLFTEITDSVIPGSVWVHVLERSEARDVDKTLEHKRLQQVITEDFPINLNSADLSGVDEVSLAESLRPLLDHMERSTPMSSLVNYNILSLAFWNNFLLGVVVEGLLFLLMLPPVAAVLTMSLGAFVHKEKIPGFVRNLYRYRALRAEQNKLYGFRPDSSKSEAENNKLRLSVIHRVWQNLFHPDMETRQLSFELLQSLKIPALESFMDYAQPSLVELGIHADVRSENRTEEQVLEKLKSTTGMVEWFQAIHGLEESAPRAEITIQIERGIQMKVPMLRSALTDPELKESAYRYLASWAYNLSIIYGTRFVAIGAEGEPDLINVSAVKALLTRPAVNGFFARIGMGFLSALHMILSFFRIKTLKRFFPEPGALSNIRESLQKGEDNPLGIHNYSNAGHPVIFKALSELSDEEKQEKPVVMNAALRTNAKGVYAGIDIGGGSAKIIILKDGHVLELPEALRSLPTVPYGIDGKAVRETPQQYVGRMTGHMKKIHGYLKETYGIEKIDGVGMDSPGAADFETNSMKTLGQIPVKKGWNQKGVEWAGKHLPLMVASVLGLDPNQVKIRNDMDGVLPGVASVLAQANPAFWEFTKGNFAFAWKGSGYGFQFSVKGVPMNAPTEAGHMIFDFRRPGEKVFDTESYTSIPSMLHYARTLAQEEGISWPDIEGDALKPMADAAFDEQDNAKSEIAKAALKRFADKFASNLAMLYMMSQLTGKGTVENVLLGGGVARGKTGKFLRHLTTEALQHYGLSEKIEITVIDEDDIRKAGVDPDTIGALGSAYFIQSVLAARNENRPEEDLLKTLGMNKEQLLKEMESPEIHWSLSLFYSKYRKSLPPVGGVKGQSYYYRIVKGLGIEEEYKSKVLEAHENALGGFNETADALEMNHQSLAKLQKDLGLNLQTRMIPPGMILKKMAAAAETPQAVKLRLLEELRLNNWNIVALRKQYAGKVPELAYVNFSYGKVLWGWNLHEEFLAEYEKRKKEYGGVATHIGASFGIDRQSAKQDLERILKDLTLLRENPQAPEEKPSVAASGLEMMRMTKAEALKLAQSEEINWDLTKLLKAVDVRSGGKANWWKRRGYSYVLRQLELTEDFKQVFVQRYADYHGFIGALAGSFGLNTQELRLLTKTLKINTEIYLQRGNLLRILNPESPVVLRDQILADLSKSNWSDFAGLKQKLFAAHPFISMEQLSQADLIWGLDLVAEFEAVLEQFKQENPESLNKTGMAFGWLKGAAKRTLISIAKDLAALKKWESMQPSVTSAQYKEAFPHIKRVIAEFVESHPQLAMARVLRKDGSVFSPLSLPQNRTGIYAVESEIRSNVQLPYAWQVTGDTLWIYSGAPGSATPKIPKPKEEKKKTRRSPYEERSENRSADTYRDQIRERIKAGPVTFQDFSSREEALKYIKAYVREIQNGPLAKDYNQVHLAAIQMYADRAKRTELKLADGRTLEVVLIPAGHPQRFDPNTLVYALYFIEGKPAAYMIADIGEEEGVEGEFDKAQIGFNLFEAYRTGNSQSPLPSSEIFQHALRMLVSVYPETHEFLLSAKDQMSSWAGDETTSLLFYTRQGFYAPAAKDLTDKVLETMMGGKRFDLSPESQDSKTLIRPLLEAAGKTLWRFPLTSVRAENREDSWVSIFMDSELTEELAKIDHPSIPKFRMNPAMQETEVQYVKGPRMSGWIQLHARGDKEIFEKQIMEWMIQIAGALEVLHAHGIEHGDVKADNVVIDASNRAVLVDFGEYYVSDVPMLISFYDMAMLQRQAAIHPLKDDEIAAAVRSVSDPVWLKIEGILKNMPGLLPIATLKSVIELYYNRRWVPENQPQISDADFTAALKGLILAGIQQGLLSLEQRLKAEGIDEEDGSSPRSESRDEEDRRELAKQQLAWRLWQGSDPQRNPPFFRAETLLPDWNSLPREWASHHWNLASHSLEDGAILVPEIPVELRVDRLAQALYEAKRGPAAIFDIQAPEAVERDQAIASVILEDVSRFFPEDLADPNSTVNFIFDSTQLNRGLLPVHDMIRLNNRGIFYHHEQQYADQQWASGASSVKGGDWFRVSTTKNGRYALLEIADGMGHGPSAMPAEMFRDAVHFYELRKGTLLTQILKRFEGSERDQYIYDYLSFLGKTIQSRSKNPSGFYTYSLALVDYKNGTVHEWGGGHHLAALQVLGEEKSGWLPYQRGTDGTAPIGSFFPSPYGPASRGAVYRKTGNVDTRVSQVVLYTDGAYQPATQGDLGIHDAALNRPAVQNLRGPQLLNALRELSVLKGTDDITILVADLRQGFEAYLQSALDEPLNRKQQAALRSEDRKIPQPSKKELEGISEPVRKAILYFWKKLYASEQRDALSSLFAAVIQEERGNHDKAALAGIKTAGDLIRHAFRAKRTVDQVLPQVVEELQAAAAQYEEHDRPDGPSQYDRTVQKHLQILKEEKNTRDLIVVLYQVYSRIEQDSFIKEAQQLFSSLRESWEEFFPNTSGVSPAEKPKQMQLWFEKTPVPPDFGKQENPEDIRKIQEHFLEILAWVKAWEPEQTAGHTGRAVLLALGLENPVDPLSEQFTNALSHYERLLRKYYEEHLGALPVERVTNVLQLKGYLFWLREYFKQQIHEQLKEEKKDSGSERPLFRRVTADDFMAYFLREQSALQNSDFAVRITFENGDPSPENPQEYLDSLPLDYPVSSLRLYLKERAVGITFKSREEGYHEENSGTEPRSETRPFITDFAEAVQRQINAHAHYARNFGVTVDFTKPDQSILIDDKAAADSKILFEFGFLHELFYNALKYSRRGGHVDIRLTKENGDAVLQIKDQGIGIAPEDLSNIGVKAYWRASNAREHYVEGSSGLGVVLSREEIENLYGGSLRVESPGLNQGTTVTLRIPLSRRLDAPRPQNFMESRYRYPIPLEVKSANAQGTFAMLGRAWADENYYLYVRNDSGETREGSIRIPLNMIPYDYYFKRWESTSPVTLTDLANGSSIPFTLGENFWYENNAIHLYFKLGAGQHHEFDLKQLRSEVRAKKWRLNEMLTGLPFIQVNEEVYPWAGSRKRYEILIRHSKDFIEEGLLNSLRRHHKTLAAKKEIKALGIGSGTGVDAVVFMNFIFSSTPVEKINLYLLDLDRRAVNNTRKNLEAWLRNNGWTFETVSIAEGYRIEMGSRGQVLILQVPKGEAYTVLDRVAGEKVENLDFSFFHAPDIFPDNFRPSETQIDLRVGMPGEDFLKLMKPLSERLAADGAAVTAILNRSRKYLAETGLVSSFLGAGVMDDTMDPRLMFELMHPPEDLSGLVHALWPDAIRSSTEVTLGAKKYPVIHGRDFSLVGDLLFVKPEFYGSNPFLTKFYPGKILQSKLFFNRRFEEGNGEARDHAILMLQDQAENFRGQKVVVVSNRQNLLARVAKKLGAESVEKFKAGSKLRIDSPLPFKGREAELQNAVLIIDIDRYQLGNLEVFYRWIPEMLGALKPNTLFMAGIAYDPHGQVRNLFSGLQAGGWQSTVSLETSGSSRDAFVSQAFHRSEARSVDRMTPEEVTEARQVTFLGLHRKLLGIFSQYKAAQKRKDTDRQAKLLAQAKRMSVFLDPYIAEILPSSGTEKVELDFLNRFRHSQKKSDATFLKEQSQTLYGDVAEYTRLFVNAYQKYQAQDAKVSKSAAEELDKLNFHVVNLLKRRLKMQLIRLQNELEAKAMNQVVVFTLLVSVNDLYHRLAYEHFWRASRKSGRGETYSRFVTVDPAGYVTETYDYERQPLLRIQVAKEDVEVSQIMWRQVEVEKGVKALEPVLTPLSFDDVPAAYRSRTHAIDSQHQDLVHLKYHDYGLRGVEDTLAYYERTGESVPDDIRESLTATLKSILDGNQGRYGLGRRIKRYTENGSETGKAIAMPQDSLKLALIHITNGELKQARGQIEAARLWVEKRREDIQQRTLPATERKRDYLYLMMRDQAVLSALESFKAWLQSRTAGLPDEAALQQFQTIYQRMEALDQTYFGFSIKASRTNDEIAQYKAWQTEVHYWMGVLRGLYGAISRKQEKMFNSNVQGIQRNPRLQKNIEQVNTAMSARRTALNPRFENRLQDPRKTILLSPDLFSEGERKGIEHQLSILREVFPLLSQPAREALLYPNLLLVLLGVKPAYRAFSNEPDHRVLVNELVQLPAFKKTWVPLFADEDYFYSGYKMAAYLTKDRGRGLRDLGLIQEEDETRFTALQAAMAHFERDKSSDAAHTEMTRAAELFLNPIYIRAMQIKKEKDALIGYLVGYPVRDIQLFSQEDGKAETDRRGQTYQTRYARIQLYTDTQQRAFDYFSRPLNAVDYIYSHMKDLPGFREIASQYISPEMRTAQVVEYLLNPPQTNVPPVPTANALSKQEKRSRLLQVLQQNQVAVRLPGEDFFRAWESMPYPLSEKDLKKVFKGMGVETSQKQRERIAKGVNEIFNRSENRENDDEEDINEEPILKIEDFRRTFGIAEGEAKSHPFAAFPRMEVYFAGDHDFQVLVYREQDHQGNKFKNAIFVEVRSGIAGDEDPEFLPQIRVRLPEAPAKHPIHKVWPLVQQKLEELIQEAAGRGHTVPLLINPEDEENETDEALEEAARFHAEDMRDQFEGALKIAHHYLNHPPQMIIATGSSAVTTMAYHLLAVQRLQPALPENVLPPFIWLFPETNEIIHKRVVSQVAQLRNMADLPGRVIPQDILNQAEALAEVQAREHREEYLNLIAEDILLLYPDLSFAQAREWLETLMSQPLAVVDDISRTGMKYYVFKGALKGLGFQNVEFAYQIASGNFMSQKPSHVLVGRIIQDDEKVGRLLATAKTNRWIGSEGPEELLENFGIAPLILQNVTSQIQIPADLTPENLVRHENRSNYIDSLKRLNPDYELKAKGVEPSYTKPFRHPALYKGIINYKESHDGPLSVAILGPGLRLENSVSYQTTEVAALLNDRQVDFTLVGNDPELLQLASQPRTYPRDAFLLIQNVSLKQAIKALSGSKNAAGDFVLDPSRIKNPIHAFVANFQEIQYGKEELDIVIATQSLLYAFNSLSAHERIPLLARVLSALKPGGELYLDNDVLPGLTHRDPDRTLSDTEERKAAWELKERLEESGMEVYVSIDDNTLEISRSEFRTLDKSHAEKSLRSEARPEEKLPSVKSELKVASEVTARILSLSRIKGLFDLLFPKAYAAEAYQSMTLAEKHRLTEIYTAFFVNGGKAVLPAAAFGGLEDEVLDDYFEPILEGDKNNESGIKSLIIAGSGHDFIKNYLFSKRFVGLYPSLSLAASRFIELTPLPEEAKAAQMKDSGATVSFFKALPAENWRAASVPALMWDVEALSKLSPAEKLQVLHRMTQLQFLIAEQLKNQPGDRVKLVGELLGKLGIQYTPGLLGLPQPVISSLLSETVGRMISQHLTAKSA